MKRIALVVIGAGSPLLLVAMLVGGAVGQALFVAAGLTFPVAVCALGAGRSRRLAIVLALLLLLLELCALGLLLVPPRMVAGLPGPTWLMLIGMALVPLIVVSLGFAATHRSRETD